MIDSLTDKNRFTILVADDSEASLGRISGFLGEEGYTVKQARDGEEALRMLKAASPDLIILDDIMPNLNGYKACIKIKEDPATRLLPVILITSMREQADRMKAVSAGADDYLTRPIDKTELSVRVHNLLSLKRMRSEVVLSQRLISLGMLAGGVAHEINNPLTGVVTNLEMLRSRKGKFSEDEILQICRKNKIKGKALKEIRDYFKALTGKEEKKRRMIELAIKGGRRCSRIVGELLSYSSAQRKWIPSKVRLKEIVERSLSLVKGQFRGLNVKIDFKLSHEQVEAMGNKWELQQVFMSLLANAFKALEKSEEKNLSISISTERNFAVVRIKDSGEGIPKENLESIFDFFYTTRDEGEGFGLGLTAVYEIILKHDGAVDVKSEPGRGTEFSVKIPLA
ncbi:MAG: hypothetical protein A2042_01870 [Candidatus Schekmanbacteria bacterium GWA2_38_11]|uniref:histidine kinase n=1 Tax=Candidatus Schekmanbacteria bacterium GWA2_38_11 TaxID=1817876 RepID=A0A1F7R915_9BACT|nr:MAG: hypothetical protein A2042_01870 [Candidatus Schekmanbacteria bacterium GWA2_38_11]